MQHCVPCISTSNSDVYDGPNAERKDDDDKTAGADKIAGAEVEMTVATPVKGDAAVIEIGDKREPTDEGSAAPEATTAEPPPKQPFSKVLELARPERPALALAFVLHVVSELCRLAQPMVLVSAYDEVPSHTSIWSSHNPISARRQRDDGDTERARTRRAAARGTSEDGLPFTRRSLHPPDDPARATNRSSPRTATPTPTATRRSARCCGACSSCSRCTS